MSLENIHHYVILPIDHNERLLSLYVARAYTWAQKLHYHVLVALSIVTL